MLADFGLSKVKREEEEETDSNSFCGTPEYLCKVYMSLSILGSAWDDIWDRAWFHSWLVGSWSPIVRFYTCFKFKYDRYEMIIGVPPFFNKNKHQMYYLI